jgi:hypothetical protein
MDTNTTSSSPNLTSASWFPNRLVSCNGAQINCSYSDGQIQADPDVADIGVSSKSGVLAGN